MFDGPCLIGVDVGTTNVKAGAFTPQGRAIATASAELQVNHPKPGWATYDPLNIWRATAKVIAEVSRSISGSFEPQAIAVSSMAETGIPIDTRGISVYEPLPGSILGPQSKLNGGQILLGRNLSSAELGCLFSRSLGSINSPGSSSTNHKSFPGLPGGSAFLTISTFVFVASKPPSSRLPRE